MTDPLTLQADICGPHAEAAEAALREFLLEQFGPAAELQRCARQPAEDAPRGPEWLEWATFALSVPGGLVAALDLAQRLKLKERVQRLLERLRSAGRGNDGTVVLKIGNQPPIDLGTATPGEVVEAVETAVAKLRK